MVALRVAWASAEVLNELLEADAAVVFVLEVLYRLEIAVANDEITVDVVTEIGLVSMGL